MCNLWKNNNPRPHGEEQITTLSLHSTCGVEDVCQEAKDLLKARKPPARTVKAHCFQLISTERELIFTWIYFISDVGHDELLLNPGSCEDEARQQ